MLLRTALLKIGVMSKSPAVLSYPNSNNLGDFIQSLAAKQVLNKIKTFLDPKVLQGVVQKNKALPY